MTAAQLGLKLGQSREKIEGAQAVLANVSAGTEYEVSQRQVDAMTEAVNAVTDVINPPE